MRSSHENEIAVRPGWRLESDCSLFGVLPLAVPLAAILFCWITKSVRIEYVDGPALTLYGFPLAWHSRDRAASLSFIVGPVALLVDLLFYFLVVFVGLSLLCRRRRIRAGVILGSILWLSAAASSALVALPYMLDYSRWGSIEIDGKIVVYSLHFGPDYTNE